MNEADSVLENPLGTQRIGTLAVQYAVPSVISLVVNSLYNMVDQIFIGQGVGYLGNAATNVIMPLTLAMMAVSLMLGNGAAAAMSLHLGRGDERAAALIVGNMAVLTVGSGVLLAAVSEALLIPLCRLFGASSGEVLSYAAGYGRIIALGFPLFAVDAAFASVIRADGRPNASMAGMLAGCIANIILDPLFIFAFGWGVEGAAWATVAGQLLCALFYAGCFLRFKTIRLGTESLRLDTDAIGRIAALGLSSFFTQIASTLVIAVQNNLLVKYGAQSKYGADIALAALGITMKTSQLITSVALGIATGVQPILGYNYGSRRFSRVKQTFALSLASCTAIMLCALFVFQVFPEKIVCIFGRESALYMEFAVKCFRIFLLACFMIPPGLVVSVFFQAIGMPMPAAALSLSRQVLLLVPAMFLLGAAAGIDGLLWAGPVADGLAGLAAIAAAKCCWKRIFR